MLETNTLYKVEKKKEKETLETFGKLITPNINIHELDRV
jgi:hypothetical protein